MPNTIIQLLVTLIQLYTFVLLGRMILSWFPNVDRTNPVVQLLHQMTDPILDPVRRMIPPLGMIDISPIVVFIGLRILQSILAGMASDF